LAIGTVGVFLTLAMFVRQRDILRREGLRDVILQETPLGSSREHVKSVIVRHKWDINATHQQDLGYYDSGRGVGVSSIRAGGHYMEWGFRVDVSIFWGFDEDGKLIGIAVRKEVDGP
jgi:hypothetical protein